MDHAATAQQIGMNFCGSNSQGPGLAHKLFIPDANEIAFNS